jgi:RNA polymerase sigma factor (sigma-70 family)
VEQTLTVIKGKEADKHTVGKEKKRLFDHIRRKVATDVDAEDILQDVFFQFYDNDRSESIQSVGAWLFRVAENKIIDWYRKKKTLSLESLKVSKENCTEDDEHALSLVDVLFDPTEKPDELYIRSQVWPMLADVLDELPEEQKEVFIMNELEEKSFKEISEITKIPINTLISRKRYAVLYLRSRLKDLYDDFFN